MRMKTRLTALLICIFTVLSLCGCDGSIGYSSEPVQKEIFAMDTFMTLTAYGKNADDGIDAAERIIMSLDSMLAPELETSYTYQINNAEGENVIVPPQVADMLTTALTVYERTGGALDLSVYPIYLAWGGFNEETGRVPSNSELSELRQLLNFGEMTVTEFPGESNYSVCVPAGTSISFGSCAKGCAAEYAIDAMRNAGVSSGLVSLGGNVQTLGLKPDGSQWKVAIEDPRNVGSYLGVVTVGAEGSEVAIVTSGNYQRYFRSETGELYHHIIDPDTGKPVVNNLLSVTIICDDGTLADCLSTAMFVLGENAALKYWRDYGGFEMVIVTDDGRVICTSGLMEIFELTNAQDYEEPLFVE